MPLTAKGEEILANMTEQYGSKEKAEQVLYASKNKGTITGVDQAAAKAKELDDSLPTAVSQAELVARSRERWEHGAARPAPGPVGDSKPKDGKTGR